MMVGAIFGMVIWGDAPSWMANHRLLILARGVVLPGSV